jgi:hypothetical protein
MKNEVENLFSEFQKVNGHLVSLTEAVLSGFIADRHLHARFLNTLSMLEQMGSHKIMATQYRPDIDQSTLKHLAEEARHAFFFRRLAEREAGRPLVYTPADLLSPPTARHYIKQLEAHVVRALPRDGDHTIPYLTMSMIVEFRAIWSYWIYQTALTRAGHSVSVKSLLANESRHLADLAERLHNATQFSRRRVYNLWLNEQRLFGRLLRALKENLSEENLSADKFGRGACPRQP